MQNLQLTKANVTKMIRRSKQRVYGYLFYLSWNFPEVSNFSKRKVGRKNFKIIRLKMSRYFKSNSKVSYSLVSYRDSKAASLTEKV